MRFRSVEGVKAWTMIAAGAALGIGFGLLARRRAPLGPAIGPEPLTLSGKGIKAGVLAVAVVLAAGLGSYALSTCRQMHERASWAAAITGGEATRAPGIMRRNGCTGCHEIPGMPGPAGTVGPPLRDLADRAFIGGVVPNTPDNLARWIRRARDLEPRSAMPDTDISEQEARDVAAYLYGQ